MSCQEIICCDSAWFQYSLNAYPVTENSEITIFVPCPEGFDCGGATVIVDGVPGVYITIPAGTFRVRPTNPDETPEELEEEEAETRAEEQASPVLNPGVVVYSNTAQSYTATCPPDKFGNPVTKTVSAGTFSSPVSVAAANALALAVITAVAEAEIECYDFTNTEQTATCNPGYTGTPVTVPAGTYFSNVSQAEADFLALTAATAALVCTPTCGQLELEALTWGHSGGGTGSGAGTTAVVHGDGSSSQSAVVTTLTNNCGSSYTVKVEAVCQLSTNNTGGVAKVEIFVAGVQVAISELSSPGPGPTCYPKNETISAQFTINALQSKQIAVACYEQAASGCTGADATVTLSIV